MLYSFLSLPPASLQRAGHTNSVVTANSVTRYVRMCECECECGCMYKIKFPCAPVFCAVTLLKFDMKNNAFYYPY